MLSIENIFKIEAEKVAYSHNFLYADVKLWLIASAIVVIALGKLESQRKSYDA